MTAPWMSRSFAVALFAVCVGFATLPGCGSPPPKGDKKDEKKDDPPLNIGVTPNPTPGPGPAPTPGVPPKNTLGDVEEAADKAATAFLTSLVQGTAKADALSAAFVKVVGKPVVLPSDKARGYSTDAATDWLKRAGDGVNIFPPTQRPKQSGDVVYMRGTIGGARLAKSATKNGWYSLRLVKEGGAWKVDWLSLSSSDLAGSVPTPTTPEDVAQEFAVVSFIETITDLDGMPKDDRTPLIAAALTPALRVAWAPPFAQDKDQGYDYSPALMGPAATKIGGGTTTFTASRVGPLEFKVELTKPAGKKAYTVRLIKGAGANEWLINEVIEVKG